MSPFLIFIHTLLGRKFGAFCHVQKVMAECGYNHTGSCARGKQSRLASLCLLKPSKKKKKKKKKTYDPRSIPDCSKPPQWFVHKDKGGVRGLISNKWGNVSSQVRAISSRNPDRRYCSQKKVDRSIYHFLTSVCKLYVTSLTSGYINKPVMLPTR